MDATPSADALLKRLEWTVIRRLDGLLQGDYRTLWRGAGLDLAIGHDARVDAGHLVVDVLDLERITLRALDLEDLLDALVHEHALGIAQRAHD